MARRPQYASSPGRPGRIGEWPPGGRPPEEIARRVRYRGNPAHKSHPFSGEPPKWRCRRSDKSKCDHFSEPAVKRFGELIAKAILSGCVHVEFKGGFPKRVWAYVNGKLHEARLTNPATGEYHGFPIEYEEQEPDDPVTLQPGATASEAEALRSAVGRGGSGGCERVGEASIGGGFLFGAPPRVRHGRLRSKTRCAGRGTRLKSYMIR